MAAKTEAERADFIRKLGEYELISGVIWIVIAAIQICTCWLAVAGVWNIFAAVSRFQSIARIKARDASLPSEYEGIGMLIALALVNLLLGGVLGVAMVAFDYYIRNLVLENRELFNGEVRRAAGPQGQAAAETSQDGAMELLTRLARLREQGALSLTEFNDMKQSLLEQFRKGK